MTNHGDDCYFFYYSTCSKGDSCPFRHCEAAMGSEAVCNLWQEGRCFRTICKFRHMEITKNRREIACYWENQPAGCQKPHCAFFHEKARYIDGVFVPPGKGLSKNEEQPQEEPAPPPTAPLPAAANPQLRGVIKTESQEPVPSPTHPPVVINPADDDEDEDDQFSEEGEDGRGGPSPRKLPKSDDSLNFGVSTLEEIRLRKALKSSMKRAGYPIQSPDSLANGEKENIQSYFRPSPYEARDGQLVFEETRRARGNVVERLGRKRPGSNVYSGDGVLVNRSLAERLGSVMDEEEPLMPPQKSFKPVRERLGLPAALDEPTHPADSNTEAQKAPEQIRIKTLEEIRQEKAAKSQSQNDGPSAASPESTKTVTIKATKGVKRAIAVKDDPISRVKTFSEVLRAKKKLEEEQLGQSPSPKKAKHATEKAPGKSQAESNTAGPDSEATNTGVVRVKTLEEIRREKAARTQTQQVAKAEKAENKRSTDNEENGVKKPGRPRINKPGSQTGSVSTEKRGDVTAKPLKSQTAAPETGSATSNNVKVKTFEEIMREKRLRRQEMEEQDKTSAEAKPSQNQTTDRSPKKKAPAEKSPASSGSSSPSSTSLTSDTTPSTPNPPARKLIPLKPRAATPLSRSSSPGTTTALTSAPQEQSSPTQGRESHSQSPRSSREVPDKNTRNSTALSPAKQPRAAPRGLSAEAPTLDETPGNNQKKSPEQTRDTKVRPKLNVKPSVVKPAVQVKPGQKRRGAGRSAVAAVKPLNSSCTEADESLQEAACRDGQVLPSSSTEAQLSSDVPHSPSTPLDSGSGSSPLREELQTVPVFPHSPGEETKPTPSIAASREACAVPQSPVLKTPTQPKARRPSAVVSRTLSTSSAAPSTSAVDDFEELMNEFTDDHLEDDVDPGMGEDDLLQELSEMIDS
ncbi:zinc finger CCCH domain-containing protein 11A isoform X1 [Scophthalmus maximus]|uniref:zinc finger CCCH domain-containing protein 11A isoform X1 n=1 Tax=Scophthalmus maximus TaxID=52904 RepID=UPI001FA909B0|nr:zinc finger CCCH domain-containing protein 11A isoform X1 [Scophthalmus maximus]XP_035486920.2 zinc finger CCCH domain-containing protein 11A isoform X1 [Scophthalmus maximus]XP_035486921.2 zinc finger CCCH domain-containing protein 11A isoform X1 [Scophthalmus maximus]XP_035486922.2 zinc finger CCCH domain-containing protein 11A isoform X1 [Scophthalmus maximus]